MKKVASLALALLLCVGLLAACGSTPNPLHDEIKTLVADVRAEYTSIAGMLEEVGEEVAAAAKPGLEMIETSLKTLEEQITDSNLAKMTEEELGQMKEALQQLKDMLVLSKDSLAQQPAA